MRTHDRWNVRKPRSKCVEDIFSAEVWLASAPLHEAGKTTKSGNTLKAGIRREELGSASDTLSSAPNACPLISTFSKPHSEVASATRISALKGSFEKALRCFLVCSRRKVPSKCSVKKAQREGNFFDKRRPIPSQQKHTMGKNSPPKDKIPPAGRIL